MKLGEDSREERSQTLKAVKQCAEFLIATGHHEDNVYAAMGALADDYEDWLDELAEEPEL